MSTAAGNLTAEGLKALVEDGFIAGGLSPGEAQRAQTDDLLRRAVEAGPGGASLPPLDPHDCRFGHWLDSIGQERYGHYPSFGNLVTAHREVHDTGRKIEALARADRSDARKQLGHLDQRRDSLLAALGELRSEVLASAT